MRVSSRATIEEVVISCIIVILWFLQSFFPYRSCEDGYSDDDESTHGTKWAEDSYDKFLRDNIRIEKDATDRHDSENFRENDIFLEPSKKCKNKKYGIDEHGYHRKCYFKISDRKNDSTRILEYTTTGEWIRNITGHHLKSFFICPIPVFIRRNREVYSIEYPDSSEYGDDNIFTHRKNRKNTHSV